MTYDILTRFVVLPTVTGLDSVTGKLQAISGQIRRIGNLFALAAGGYGAGKLLSAVIGVNSEIQNAQIGIGGLISALGHVDMATGIKLARKEMVGLRQDAAKGAGGLADYVKGFQAILGPAGAAGASLEQVRELNRLVLGASFGLRGKMGLRTGPIDVVQALQRGASMAVTPIVSEALMAIGVTDKQFNAMDPAKQFQTLMKAFQAFQGAVDEMGKTWDARVETMRDNLAEIVRRASGPLFDRANDSLGEMNDWLAKNRDLIYDMAERAGGRLAQTFDRMKAQPAGTAGAVGALVAGAAGARIAGGMVPSLPNVSLPPPNSVWNAAAGRWQSFGTGKFMAPTALAGSGAVASFGWAAAITGVLAFLGGAMAAAASKFTAGTRRLINAAGSFGIEAGNLWESVVRFFNNSVVVWIGDQLLNLAAILVEAAGKTMRVLQIMIDFFNGAVSSGVWLGRAIQAAGTGRFADAQGFLATSNSIYAMASGNASVGFAQLFKDLPGPVKIAPGTEGLPGTKPGEVPTYVTNINGPVNIRIQAERLDDPNVVASSFQKALEKIRNFPTVSPAARMLPRPL